jgi:hypothetical protein
LLHSASATDCPIRVALARRIVSTERRDADQADLYLVRPSEAVGLEVMETHASFRLIDDDGLSITA